jgi:hypothetical protein
VCVCVRHFILPTIGQFYTINVTFLALSSPLYVFSLRFFIHPAQFFPQLLADLQESSVTERIALQQESARLQHEIEKRLASEAAARAREVAELAKAQNQIDELRELQRQADSKQSQIEQELRSKEAAAVWL